MEGVIMTLEEAQTRAQEIKDAFLQGTAQSNRDRLERYMEEIDRITREYPEVKEVFRDPDAQPVQRIQTGAYPCRDFDD